jgi:Fe2+ transport system protein B
MDNQNDTNDSMQNPLNYNETERSADEQGLYNSNHQQNNMNDNQQYYSANGIPQNDFIMNSMIDSLSGWMKFMGIYTIIAGAISCLGIITAAIGVPLIFAGIALNKSSDNIKNYKQSSNPHVLNEVFTSLNKYFKIQGILTIVGIVLSVIYFIFIIFLLVYSSNRIFDFY